VQSHVLDAKTLTPEQRNALREILIAAKEAK